MSKLAKKQKNYRSHLREQTLNGYVNRADGNWAEKRFCSNTECSDHKFNCVQKGTKGKKNKYE